MKMVHNLIIVLLIIGFSFLFESSCNYEFNTQLTFILLSLFIVIIYKFLINKCLIKENFSNSSVSFDEQINSFLNQGLPDQETSRADMVAYSKELTELQDKVDIMNEYLNDIKQTAEGKNKGETLGDQLNIQASQQIQDYRIREMQKEIERTTDLIKEAKMREDASKFKKIPIYSSCVVSNADGSLQVDKPLPNNNQSSSLNEGANVNTLNVPNGSNTGNTNILRNVNNTGDAPPSTSSSDNQKINGNTNKLSAMLKHILEKGVNVNLQAN